MRKSSAWTPLQLPISVFWPGIGGSDQGPQNHLACASLTFPWISTRDPKDATAAVLVQSKGWILGDTPPHLPQCLEHPHLG